MTTQWSISAPASWWVPVIKAVGLCSEPQKGTTDTLSFMSCALIDIKDGNAKIISQSLSSALEVEVAGNGTVEGEGRVMVSVKDLAHAVSSLPHGDNIVVSYPIEQESEDVQSINLANEDGSINFSVFTEDIIDDDMIPHPPEVAEEDVFTEVNFSDLSYAYKQGGMMSKSVGSEERGYDPLSGAIININDKGVQVLSLAISSSEALVPVEKGHENYTANCISSPQATTARLDTFASYSSKGNLAVAKTGHLVFSGSGMVMSVAPLNTGSMKNTVVTYKTIIEVLSPAWENRIVTLQAPSKEFFLALSRANSVSDENIRIFIDDTTITVCGVDSRREDYSFTQEIGCSTTWHNDDVHEVTYSMEPSIMKKVSGFVSKEDEVNLSIAYDETGTAPWAMMIYGDDFDVDNPHDFFLIAISK